jgi:hypothetical protein
LQPQWLSQSNNRGVSPAASLKAEACTPKQVGKS